MIFTENQQFYILKVHEEIISAWKHLRNVNITYAAECERKGVYLPIGPYGHMATLLGR